MTTTTQQPSATELWNIISKEITGIQLLWEIANGLYFKPNIKVVDVLQKDIPLIYIFTQTTLMESLLMRVSRLMDPSISGKGIGQKPNLSLKRLVETDPRIDPDEKKVRSIWDSSGLKTVRDKYLSHNDLHRSLNEEHTLNIPLEPADIEALRQLAEGLRELRRDANYKLNRGAWIDQDLDVIVRRQIETLGNVIAGGDKFFKELPDRLLASGN